MLCYYNSAALSEVLYSCLCVCAFVCRVSCVVLVVVVVVVVIDAVVVDAVVVHAVVLVITSPDLVNVCFDVIPYLVSLGFPVATLLIVTLGPSGDILNSYPALYSSLNSLQ